MTAPAHVGRRLRARTRPASGFSPRIDPELTQADLDAINLLLTQARRLVGLAWLHARKEGLSAEMFVRRLGQDMRTVGDLFAEAARKGKWS